MNHSRLEHDVIDSAWTDIKTHLEDEKAKIFAEIKNYPPPITACDQQFDHLLEQRDRISGELQRAHDLSARNVTNPERLELVGEFVAASQFFDDDEGLRIKKSVIQRLSKLKS